VPMQNGSPNRHYRFNLAPTTWWGRLLLGVGAVAGLVVGVLLGIVFFAVAFAALAVGALVVAVRLWWLRRQFVRQRGRQDSRDLAVEYTVVEDGERRWPPRGDDR
jgi:predicted lipid-binding transport protein (Tim44 family)